MAVEQMAKHRAPATAKRMAAAARAFLGGLTPEQRRAAAFPFEGHERYEWAYTPVARNGLRLKDMDGSQRQAALALMDSGLSTRGTAEARAIIELESILDEAERLEEVENQWRRDPELYWFSVFGEPGGQRPWGWRAGGHHIGVHLTVIDGDLVAPMPFFLGANPAEVRHGAELGKRILAAEEDMGRAVLQALTEVEKKVAIVDPVAPADIATRNHQTAHLDDLPQGLSFEAMNAEARERVVRLVRHYVERTSGEIALNEWTRIERSGLGSISFAWAGPEERERGNGHYYAVRGQTFLVEYDNTQNDANHIHAVIRDMTNDWGEDLLAAHYARSHAV